MTSRAAPSRTAHMPTAAPCGVGALRGHPSRTQAFPEANRRAGKGWAPCAWPPHVRSAGLCSPHVRGPGASRSARVHVPACGLPRRGFFSFRSPRVRTCTLAPCPGAARPRFALRTCGLPCLALPRCARPRMRPAHVRPPPVSPPRVCMSPSAPCPRAAAPSVRPRHVRTSPRAACPRAGLPRFALPTCARPHLRPAHVWPPWPADSPRAHRGLGGLHTCAWGRDRVKVRRAVRTSANVPTRVQTCALRSLARRTVSLPYSRGGSCAVARFARVRSFAGRACGLRCSRDGLVAVGRFAHLRSFAGCKSGPVTCGVHRTATGALCTPQDRGRSMRRAGVATGALCSPHPPRIAQGAESARPRCARVACAARPRVRFVQTPRPKVLSVSSRGHRFGTLPLNHSAIGPS
jgi:hypothetical protein